MKKQLTQEDIDQNPFFEGVPVGSLVTISQEEQALETLDGDPIPKDPTKPEA